MLYFESAPCVCLGYFRNYHSCFSVIRMLEILVSRVVNPTAVRGQLHSISPAPSATHCFSLKAARQISKWAVDFPPLWGLGLRFTVTSFTGRTFFGWDPTLGHCRLLRALVYRWCWFFHWLETFARKPGKLPCRSRLWLPPTHLIFQTQNLLEHGRSQVFICLWRMWLTLDARFPIGCFQFSRSFPDG